MPNQRIKLSSKVIEKDGAKQFSLFIPGKLPNFNDLERESRGNKYNAAKIKKRWIGHISNLIRTEVDSIVWQSVNLHFEWIETNKRRDPDNIAAAKELIINGLKAAGVIPNDGWQQIKPPLVDTWKVGKVPGVLVTVKEVK